MNSDAAYDRWLDEPMERAEAQAARAEWEEEQQLEAVTRWLDRAPVAHILKVWRKVAWDTPQEVELSDLLLMAAFDPYRIDSAKTIATNKISEFLATYYEEWQAEVDKLDDPA